ncbi:MAG TPA: C-type lectin domain-containing protein [Schlesneria sp.]|jgi:hypothetical protein
MNFRINNQFAAIAILLSTSSLMGDDTKPAPQAPATPAAAAPEIAPFLIPSVEEKFGSEAAKADAATAKAEQEATKAKKAASEVRLKAYKDKLAEITKTGDFDKAQQVKARITQLENEPEGESHKPEKPTKRPRPKDTVKFGGHTYALIKEPATWHVAKHKCEEMGGHLVCLESLKEAEFVASLCKSTVAWIGATDEVEEGKWRWVNGSDAPMPPNAINGDNGLSHSLCCDKGVLNDGSAGERFGFICEWER